ncbi:unnamed protein product [Parascedosporium putredinis]|uniref:Major facilitator superfamily (MFS) profile domain-containing protein n=1 Tax=Parascedosporium putredinis TaxID=1442378 RepID=A0A9P1H1N4_9PEZI|nr:unnamed protein product [Parascedosporium putredinis]CAI7993950.1 unnamed protein product [Parascedosporium putredinis]
MGKLANISVATFAAIGSFLFGYDAGVMTDVIASQNFLDFFNTTDTSPVIGAINATFNGGAVFGALFGGVIMDKYGRRKTIGTGAVIGVLGGILQAAAYHTLAALGPQANNLLVPVYQSECAHPKIRGLIVGLAQQMIGCLPAAMLAIGMIWFPESPRHLIATDRLDEGMKILRRLHYDGTNEDWIQAEFNEIKLTIDAEKAATAPGWLIMFRVPQWRRRLMLATLVQVFTQFTGINVIGYYQTIMYKALGITGKTNLLVAGIYNCVGPIANLIFITFFIDRVGRKKPLIFGTIAIAIALICEGSINSQNTDGTREGLSIAGVAFLFCVTILFSCSFGPISWTYMSEVLPYQVRSKGSAFATGIGNWLVATFWAQVSPSALDKLGWKFYFLFVAWDLLITLPCLFFFFKETKGLSLEEIDLLFGGRALGTLDDDITKKEKDIVAHDEDPDKVA